MQSPAGFERQQKTQAGDVHKIRSDSDGPIQREVDDIILDLTSPTESGRMMWLAFILSSHYS